MLTVDLTLPLTALIGAEAPALAAAVAAAGGHWWQAGAEMVELDGEVVTGWRPRAGDRALAPALPNRGQSRLVTGPAGPALRFETGLHCGLWLAEAGRAERFSVVIRYSPGREDAKTLVTLNLRDTKDYLFLAETEGALRFKTQSDSAEVTLRPRDAGPRLAFAGLSGGRLFLRAGNETAVSTQPTLTLDGAADLFLGCRSNRDGLVKTLGDSLVSDLFLLPVNMLDPQDPAAPALAAAFDAWRHWGG